jgi:hypothetical protein
MERVFETINKNSFRKLDKNLINKQFKELNKEIVKKTEEKKEEVLDYHEAVKQDISEYDDFDYLGLNKDISVDNQSKIEREKKNKLIKTKKMELNAQAKFLMREFHDKTHFKGVTSLLNMVSNGKINSILIF